MINIVIADDHEIFRQGLCGLISSAEDINLSIVGEASTGNEAIRLIKEKKPDVAILDVSMPEKDGFEVAREIYRVGMDTKIIILTMHKERSALKKAMDIGIQGFIIKDDTFDDLIYGIKAILSGKQFISPSVSHLIYTVGQDLEESLTKREIEILRLVSNGMTNKKIADNLNISVKTVDTHRTRIMFKLDVHSTAELVKYSIKNGLLEI